MTENSTARGIEIMMMSVERQLPRNSRIITPVSAAAMMPLPDHPRHRGGHENRLIAHRGHVERIGQAFLDFGQHLLGAFNDIQRGG